MFLKAVTTCIDGITAAVNKYMLALGIPGEPEVSFAPTAPSFTQWRAALVADKGEAFVEEALLTLRNTCGVTEHQLRLLITEAVAKYRCVCVCEVDWGLRSGDGSVLFVTSYLATCV